MICRNRPLGDGEPRHWLLVDQIDHARLSGELASRIVLPASLLGNREGGTWRDEIVFAITHHDDGWREWDSAPQLDPISGQPINFTEMAIADSLAIWRQSILLCGDESPLAGYAVAGHFLRLLGDSHHADAELSLAWRNDIEQLQQQWLSASDAPGVEVADNAVSLVRAFDWLSLWLCCYSALHDEDRSTMPATDIDESIVGCSLTFASRAPSTIEVGPFCFERAFTLKLPARLVQATRYTDAARMLLQCEATTIDWHFNPPG